MKKVEILVHITWIDDDRNMYIQIPKALWHAEDLSGAIMEAVDSATEKVTEEELN